jgi:starch synthase (maltosyl-transferring)
VDGTEEYADSEKYQIRTWDWDRPGNITELIVRVNQIRRAHPALHANQSLRFHTADNPQIIAYSKTSTDGDTVFVVVNLDPHATQHGLVQVPAALLTSLGIDPAAAFGAHDLVSDARYVWHGEWNYVRFDPGIRQAHILTFGHA